MCRDGVVMHTVHAGLDTIPTDLIENNTLIVNLNRHQNLHDYCIKCSSTYRINPPALQRRYAKPP